MGNGAGLTAHQFDPHTCAFVSEKLLESFHKLEAVPEFRTVFMEYFIIGGWTINKLRAHKVVNEFIAYTLPNRDFIKINEYESNALYMQETDDVAIIEWRSYSPLAQFVGDFSRILPLLLANAVLQYVHSKEYKLWSKSHEKNQAVVTKQKSTSRLMMLSTRLHTQEVSDDEDDEDDDDTSLSSKDPADLAGEAFSLVGLQNEVRLPRIRAFVQEETTAMLSHTHDSVLEHMSVDVTLGRLLHLLDDIPVAITISSTKANQYGAHPLVFVNKAFEKLTQYNRREVLNKPSNFLKSEEYTEMCQDERIVNALRDMHPVRISITHVRKDGAPFQNLLAIEPIITASRKLHYFLAVHYDIAARQPCCPKYDLQVIDDLIHLLAGVLAQ